MRTAPLAVLTLLLCAEEAILPAHGSPLLMLRQFWAPIETRMHDLRRSSPRFPKDFEVGSVEGFLVTTLFYCLLPANQI